MSWQLETKWIHWGLGPEPPHPAAGLKGLFGGRQLSQLSQLSETRGMPVLFKPGGWGSYIPHGVLHAPHFRLVTWNHTTCKQQDPCCVLIIYCMAVFEHNLMDISSRQHPPVVLKLTPLEVCRD